MKELKGFIHRLKEQVIFQGKRVYEGGLRFGLLFNETADQCDDQNFMDVQLLDFPSTVIVIERDRHGYWKPISGSIMNEVDIFHNELVAGWVLQRLGFSVPIKVDFVENINDKPDFSFYIPYENGGFLLQWIPVYEFLDREYNIKAYLMFDEYEIKTWLHCKESATDHEIKLKAAIKFESLGFKVNDLNQIDSEWM